MGKNRKSSNGGSQPTTPSPDQINAWIETMFEEVPNLWEEQCEEFVDSVVNNGFQIESIQYGIIKIVSTDPNNNDVLRVSYDFLNRLSNNSARYSMSSIMDEYSALPDFLKNGNGNGGVINFTTQQSGGSWSPISNDVDIPASTLTQDSNHPYSLRSVLIHEMTHRADFEYSNRNEDWTVLPAWKSGNSSRAGSNLARLGQFRRVSTYETASAYSRSYKYTAAGNKVRSERKKLAYDTENLAETMMVMHQIHKFGDNAKVEDPRQNDRLIRITGKEWKKINPDLAEIGEKLYNAKNYDEFKSIMVYGETGHTVDMNTEN